MRVPDGKLAERQLVGEEGRCRRRALTIEQVFADLYRLLGHMDGDTKRQRVGDLAATLEVGESTINNVLFRIFPVGDALLTAMYGDEPNGTMHPDWAANPADWGPITPWGQPSAAAGEFAGEDPNTTAPTLSVSPAEPSPPPPAVGEAEADSPPPPPPILTPAVAAPASVFSSLPNGIRRDAEAIAEKMAPILASPIAAAIDLLRDQREVAAERQRCCQEKVTKAVADFDAAEAAVMKITNAIEVLEELDA